VFPRGGIHWNSLTAAEATQVVIAKLNQLNPLLRIPPLAWTAYMSNVAHDSDRDLVDVLNLLRTNWYDRVPELTFTDAAACDRSISVAFVGGSFISQMAEMMAKIGCIDKVDHYFYLHVAHFRSPGAQQVGENLPTSDLFGLRADSGHMET